MRSPVDRLSIGVDFEWIQNSTHDDLPLNIGANQALISTGAALPLNWDDSISVGIGGEFDLTEQITLRAGYLYSDSPINARTYNPSVPADDRHMISVGVGYEWDNKSIDFAYSYITMDSSNIAGNVQAAFNGNYRYHWDILTLSYTVRY